MNLLANAIESIKAGVEDYEDGSHGRLLSAVRNIHAGILLLYKERLRRLSLCGSDEVLVKAKVVPRLNAQGNVEFFGGGNKTVDTQQIKERFDGLNIVTDWTRFEQIGRVRNEVEHYYSVANKKALESVISNAFVLVRNFIANELKDDPLAHLGEQTWQAMLKVSEVYQAERAECEEALTDVDWQSEALSKGVLDLTCPSCSGSLLRPVGKDNSYDDSMSLQCRVCGEEIDSTAFVSSAVALALKWEKYLVYDDGAEEPYITCPECSNDTYVMDERRCAWCGHKAEHKCAMCSNTIPVEELICSPYCGYCAYMMSKND
jgi:hypothetical protein